VINKMRENLKSIGLILAIAIASVSLPIGIMGYNKTPIVNYYTENYYTTNNNTTIINNYDEENNETSEPIEHITYPLEITNYYNISFPVPYYPFNYFTERVFNISENNVLVWRFNISDDSVGVGGVGAIAIRDSMYDLWTNHSGYLDDSLGSVSNPSNQVSQSFYWIPPFQSLWHIVFYSFPMAYPESRLINITLYTEVF